MTLERRYRRVLRALPREYRRAWEEDMVSTFLDSAPARVPVGERLSVLGLAVRLRLTGAYASPRALVRHRTRLPRLRAQRVGAGHALLAAGIIVIAMTTSRPASGEGIVFAVIVFALVLLVMLVPPPARPVALACGTVGLVELRRLGQAASTG